MGRGIKVKRDSKRRPSRTMIGLATSILMWATFTAISPTQVFADGGDHGQNQVQTSLSSDSSPGNPSPSSGNPSPGNPNPGNPNPSPGGGVTNTPEVPYALAFPVVLLAAAILVSKRRKGNA